jgi:hypothetical protein
LAAAALAGCGKSKTSEQSSIVGNVTTQQVQANNEAVAVQQPSQQPESIDFSSPVSVAFAFARAAVEADGETYCQLKDDSNCDPDTASEYKLDPSEMPKSVKSYAENNHRAAVDLEMQNQRLWCVQLNDFEGRWLVEFYDTAPPGGQCNQ